jgi:cobalt transporter subunit CbtA
MIIRVLFAALAAGLVAGILMSPLQYTKVVPIILHAEKFEGDAHHDHGVSSAMVDHAHSDGKVADGKVADGKVAAVTEPEKVDVHVYASPAEAGEEPLLFGRFWNTMLANLVTGVGFALLMAGVSLASGVNVSFATGLVWGGLGWLCVQFLPALGLPPELPGFPEVDITARQTWWVATVALSITGFWLLLLTKSQAIRVLGLALLFVPHLYGAPQPLDIASAVPAYLAAQFAVATLATTMFFWVTLGLALGFFMDRMKIEEA